jgi:S1-C subfamily serine protease
VVSCLDEDRGTVSRVAAGLCAGKVVPEDVAQERRAERARLARAVVAAPPDEGAGKIAAVGTGFFVGARGEVLTNQHVVEGCRALTVLVPGVGRRQATPLARDEAADLALLDTAAPPPARARFSAAPGLTQSLHGSVVGFPSLGAPTVTATLTAVRPADPSRGSSFSLLGPIRHGHSGSPVLDQSGLVIGVVRARVDPALAEAATGRRIENVGVAVTPGVTLDFLDAHGVEVDRAVPGPAAGDAAVLREAGRWTVRVECRR